MCRYLVIFILAALPLGLFGAEKKANPDDIEIIAGEWEEVNGVKKLYDTPIGAVYKFGLSLSWTCTPYNTGDSEALDGARYHNKKCKCGICRKMDSGIDGVLLASLGKKGQKRKRFVVIDFYMRAFPAIDSQETADFAFQLIRSEEAKIRSSYRSITGILYFEGGHSPIFSTEFVRPPNFNAVETRGMLGKSPFIVYSYRIIFDTFTGKNLRIIRNGCNQITYRQPEAPAPDTPIEINSFGIINQKRNDTSDLRRKYLEISQPKIYRFSSEKQIENLPELTAQMYPYNAYLPQDSKDKTLSPEQKWNKAKSSKNPDQQYAYALHYLYSDECNPSQAIKLLKEAEKDRHVLAKYELGVCYFRGYGVAPDLKMADKYLKEAEDFGYRKATVLRKMIEWKERHRPKFYIGKRWGDSITKFLDSFSVSGDHDAQVFPLFSNSGIRASAESSPKSFRVGYWLDLWNMLNKLPNAGEIVERSLAQNRNSGYIPVYLTEALYFKIKKSDPQTVIRLLQAGSNAGDLEARSKLFLEQAKNGKLPKTEFNAINNLLLADDPDYLILDYALHHPNTSGMSEFIAENYAAAKAIWDQHDSPEYKYLSALLTWSQMYPHAQRHGVPICYPSKTRNVIWINADTGEKVKDKNDIGKKLKVEEKEKAEKEILAFGQLKIAAKAGIPEAMYLLARQYVNCDYPTGDNDAPSDFQAKLVGERWMRKAAQAGHPMARFTVLDWDSENALNSRQEQILKENEEFCRLNYPPALLLKAKILDWLGRTKEAVVAYEDAADKGAYQAWRILALKQEIGKDKNAANQLWGKYIRADREFRQQDRYDVFYPTIKFDTNMLQRWAMTSEEFAVYQTHLKDTQNLNLLGNL